jgi:fumarate reductase flavoprotein subunit
MWDDVGIIRTAESLARGLARLEGIEAELDATGIADADRAFNLTWHDWLNLKNLIATSKVIAAAAVQRQNSRGAHFRTDFPGEGDLPTSTFTVARLREDKLHIADEPVEFTIVKPGETLLKSKDAAE